MLAKADVFLQNLKPGALAKLGYPIERLRQKFPRLICCSISGYGDEGPYRDRKAYDLLIQAESGLASITGGPEGPARVGVSLVDIGTGLHAYEAILEALMRRASTGQGADIRVSMFDAMMEWMAMPLLFGEYGDAPKRVGLTHFSVAPYGVFPTRDGTPILISVQNDREWSVFCSKVLDRPELATDPRFATNPARIANRAETDGLIGATLEHRTWRRYRDSSMKRRSRLRGSTMSRPCCGIRTCGVSGGLAATGRSTFLLRRRASREGEPEFRPAACARRAHRAVRREFLGLTGCHMR